MVFSTFQNVKSYFEKGKDIDFNSRVSTIWLNRSPDYVKGYCEKIVRYINNGHFDLQDFKIYLLYHFIFNDRLYWKDVKVTEIQRISTLFTEKNLRKEEAFMLELAKKLKIKNINTYYKTNSDGNNILLDLILKGMISPLFYIVMFEHGWDESENKYDVSNQLIKLNNITKLILNRKGERRWLKARLNQNQREGNSTGPQ